MVVVTIVTQKKGETVYFEDPIPKVHFMKLISCSLFNSWHTLENEGSAALGDKERDNSLSISKLKSIAKEIDGLFEKYNYKQLETEINKPVKDELVNMTRAWDKKKI